MENSGGEAADDQGSGWFEVKKKHRSSSKFSLQSWVGGFSGKSASNFQRGQPSTTEKSRNLDGKHRSQKAGGSFGIHGEGAVGNLTPMVNDDKKGMEFLDKSLVKQDSESHNSSELFVANSVGGNGVIQKLSPKDKPDVVHKIKWGDLEDDVEHLRENSVGAEIKFGDIGHDNLVTSKKHWDNQDLFSGISSSTILQGNQLAAKPVNIYSCPHKMNLLTCKDQISERNYEEPKKVSSEDVGILNTIENVMDADASNSKVMHRKDDKIVNNDHQIEIDDPQVPVITSEVDNPKVSGEAGADDGSSALATGRDTECHVLEKNGPEISVDPSCTASVDKDCSSSCATVQDDLSKSQSLSALGEDDSSESKERFRQRLWCFLFENLNRAVDELYLLCELECDLEMMKEAILVLEEAASDFRELTTRVEEFEIVKKSSSQSIDGAPITLKADHRRPHALSWEVRRMTNSPHKAEILSSSLEAFKKIQKERASLLAANSAKLQGLECSNCHHTSENNSKKAAMTSVVNQNNSKDSVMNSRKQPEIPPGNTGGEKHHFQPGRSSKVNFIQNGKDPSRCPSSLNLNSSKPPTKDTSAAIGSGISNSEHLGFETDKQISKKDKISTESIFDKNFRPTDPLRKQICLTDKDKEKRNATTWKSMDAWKEKRNWEDILSSSFRVSSRISHSPGMSRRSAERARILHDKLMTPEKKKKTALDLKKEAAEKHSRAMRIRSELENERVQRLQRTSEKLNRVNVMQAVRTMKLREDMHARHQRSELRHEAFLAQVVRRAGDESSKVNEVRFITSLNEENKKLILRQKLQDSELRRAEKRQVLRTKQKEDIAREEAVLERRKLIEAEKLQRLAETQRKKEEALVRREEERKASSAAREARAIEQLRRKEERAKAQQEEAELLAQKLAEKLSESEQRRKFYLEQIRERASMDFRDQSSPLVRRAMGRSTPINNNEDCQSTVDASAGVSNLAMGNASLQHSLKRRIKRIRQRLMAMKYEFPEPSVGSENAGIGYRTAVATARAKIGRWLQELQKLRQARKGAASIGLITAEMIKFLEGKEPELQASHQAGLLDFIASALPASHTSKPEACQVTVHLLKLLRVVLTLPSNRSYFLAQNLLPPIIPMLSAALENYIKIAASLNAPGSTNSSSSKLSVENFETISEVLDGFLWTVATIIGQASSDERQLQMCEGLLELLIAYQVIHRLRDLFALYDRPQVEGSPFPSSILLSISLLVVVTSTPGTVSPINWESFPFATVAVNGSPKAKHTVSDAGYVSANNASGDMIEPLLDVSEDSPLDGLCKVTKGDSVGNDYEKKLNDSSVELIYADREKTDGLDESRKTVTEEKDEKHLVDMVSVQKDEKISSLKQPVAFLLSAISETGLVSLPSLLTSVLLQANNRLSSEQVSFVIPSNFEEAATGVLKVLNNLALLDIMFMQKMLARPDLKMEFFHVMSFLLSHCTSKWKVANDQVGLLLSETLLLLGHFALFHPGNQAVLRWGHSPTILHKVCDLPFVFFSDPELMPITAGTLVAACYGCGQNKDVVQQELSMDMLLSLLRSCRNVLPATQPNSDIFSMDDTSECNVQKSESRKSLGEIPIKASRYNGRSTRVCQGKVGGLGNNMRIGKMKNQRDGKAAKSCQDMTMNHNPQTSIMLHSRFPSSFLDKAEQFFSVELTRSG